MDKMNTTRVSEDKNSKEGEFEFYLKAGLPSTQVVAMLRAQGKDQKEIDAFMEKYEVSRKKIAKVVKRFVEKIEAKYGHLDIPELVKKGMKHATRHDFSPAERDAFIRFVMKGDTETPYLPFQELGYTEMSKFLGFSNTTGQTITVKATDHPALQEIAKLYEQNKLLHSGIRQNLVTYTSCDPNALISEYNKEKDNLNMFIHPLIVALFLPRIRAIERRMLYSNIGRFVVQRTQMYFQNADKRYMGWTLSLNDLIPGELEADLEFMYEIAKDPNSLDHFSDESPMSNLLKRFQVQIELWKNVLSLRQGQYYSRSENCVVGCDDGIMGLHKVLSSYNWTYFDSPDMYHVHDEGTLLRKLLAVFSFRPTFTQISSFAHRSGLGYSNLGAVRATYVNTPICNLRLPSNLYGGAPAGTTIRLESALSNSGVFIENKMLVPKNTSVIHSRQVVFFYVNRRYQSPLANVDMGFRYMSVPGTMSALTNINTTPLEIPYDLTIGHDRFQLTSVVVLNPLIEGQLATGCSSIVIAQADKDGARTRKSFYYYNPLGAGILYEDKTSGKYVRNTPITLMPERSLGKERPGFNERAREYGTIFVYVNPNEEM
jgi:hypothetical protein